MYEQIFNVFISYATWPRTQSAFGDLGKTRKVTRRNYHEENTKILCMGVGCFAIYILLQQ